MINYVIIGGGWRAEFYLRIAELVPDKFNVAAICIRNNDRSEYIKKKYYQCFYDNYYKGTNNYKQLQCNL